MNRSPTPSGEVPPLLLSEGTRLIHIGPHKTGTTSLQNALKSSSESMLQQGVYYAAPNDLTASNRAARALLRLPFNDPNTVVPYKEWEEQVALVQESSAKRIVISGEEFSLCARQEIIRLRQELGSNQLHIVITIRPLEKILPSQWQLDYRGRYSAASLEAWLRANLEPQGFRNIAKSMGFRHPLWFRHRHDELVNRWASVVGLERVTVVVADDRNHRALLSAFEGMLGLSSETLSSVDGKSNPALSGEEIEIFEQLERLIADRDLSFSTPNSRRQALRRLRVHRPLSASDSKIVVPEWSREAIRVRSEAIHDGLLESGVRIIGDLSLVLGGNVATQESKAINRSEVEEVARWLAADLEEDGKVRSIRHQFSVVSAVSKVVRRISRAR